MNYYKDNRYVSNSALSRIERALIGAPDIKGGFLQFGSLVDALITEPELVDFDNKTITDSAGDVFAFTQADWAKAEQMRQAAYQHPFLKLMVQSMEFQCEKYIDNFLVDSSIASFYLPVKCKYDGVNWAAKFGMDLKTTSCTNMESFKKSIELFSYDRQAAWYMDLGGLNRFVFAGISKIKNKLGEHEIFIHAVERGDAMYKAGLAKYQRLALLYDMLIFKTAV